MNDPIRFNRPSASAFPRLAACPASHRLGLDAVAQGMAPAAGEDADSGTRIHKALETLTWDSLSLEELQTAERCRVQIEQVFEEWCNSDGAEVFKERRLYMLNSGIVCDGENFADGRGLMFSGQADWIYIQGERGLIVDTKTGRGEYESAEGNIQLMCLAVLAAGRWNLKSVRVAIVQPLAGQPTVADFTQAQLPEAAQVSKEIVRRSDASDGTDATPGDHCRYCDARVICPALNEKSKVTPAMLENIQSHSHLAPPDLLSQALNALPAIKGYIEAVESVAKARLERGEEIPGYCLKERKGKREIGDVTAAYEALPLSPRQFIDCCTPSIPKLEAALVSSGSATSGPKAKALLTAALGPNLTQKTSMVLSKVSKELE